MGNVSASIIVVFAVVLLDTVPTAADDAIQLLVRQLVTVHAWLSSLMHVAFVEHVRMDFDGLKSNVALLMNGGREGCRGNEAARIIFSERDGFTVSEVVPDQSGFVGYVRFLNGLVICASSELFRPDCDPKFRPCVFNIAENADSELSAPKTAKKFRICVGKVAEYASAELSRRFLAEKFRKCVASKGDTPHRSVHTGITNTFAVWFPTASTSRYAFGQRVA